MMRHRFAVTEMSIVDSMRGSLPPNLLAVENRSDSLAPSASRRLISILVYSRRDSCLWGAIVVINIICEIMSLISRPSMPNRGLRCSTHWHRGHGLGPVSLPDRHGQSLTQERDIKKRKREKKKSTDGASRSLAALITTPSALRADGSL